MNRLRGSAALATLVAAVVGTPWALLQYGHWPVTGVPTAEQVRNLGDSVVSDTAVFGVLTVAAWVVWALFLRTLVVEIASAARGVQAPRVTLAGPLQGASRYLVAAVLLALTVNQPARPAAARTEAAPPSNRPASTHVVTAEPVSPPAVPTPPIDAVPAVEERVVTVGRGDSAWSIAEAHLGDGMRWRDLWSLNQGQLQPDGRAWTDQQVIRPGWRLRLPEPRPDSAGRGTTTHVVLPGDTLGDIAETHLGDADRFPAIFETNRDVLQPDGERLTDPDLIRPGWELTVPIPATEADSDGVPATQHEPAPPPPPMSSPPTSSPPSPSPPTTAPPQTSTVPPSVPTTSPPAPPATAPSAALSDADTESGSWTADAVPTIVGVTGAVVLASGLAVHLRRLRRRRTTRSASLARALPGRPGQTEAAVLAAADVPLVRWAGQEIARLIGGLDRRRVNGAPVAVELSDAGIEMLWSDPQTDAPSPWRATDGGWAWRLSYDPDAAVPADDRPAAIPALVTVGTREGRQLLVDLEAYGAVAVTGDPAQVDAFLRSVALELAAGTDLADAYVHVVGVDVGIEQLDRLDAMVVSHAVDRLKATSRSVAQVLERTGVGTTFAARVGDPVPIEATVVVARTEDADDARRLLDVASPRQGVAVIVGTDADAPARIDLRADGTALFEPLGVVFDPVGLPFDGAVHVGELLESLEDLDRQPDPDPAEEQMAGLDVCGNGHHSNGAPAARAGHAVEEPQLFTSEPVVEPEMEPALLVRVLGVPSVPERPNLGRRELIVTVLLACRSGPIPASAVQDALWGGKPVEPKTVWNLIGATRTALGELADGTPVLPAADRVHQTLRVAPGVTTDLALLRRMVADAGEAPSSEALGLLREALELVDGPPFDAAGFDWAHRDQDVAEAATLIGHATERLVDLALDASQLDVARDATVRGLRGLPGNEELYRLRMRVEHHAGNLPGVVAAHEELVTYLTDFDTEPSPATINLYQDLVPVGSRRR